MGSESPPSSSEPHQTSFRQIIDHAAPDDDGRLLWREVESARPDPHGSKMIYVKGCRGALWPFSAPASAIFSLNKSPGVI